MIRRASADGSAVLARLRRFRPEDDSLFMSQLAIWLCAVGWLIVLPQNDQSVFNLIRHGPLLNARSLWIALAAVAVVLPVVALALRSRAAQVGAWVYMSAWWAFAGYITVALSEASPLWTGCIVRWIFSGWVVYRLLAPQRRKGPP